MNTHQDLGLSSPYLNVSGFLGFNPVRQLERCAVLGGWITPGISYRRRQPASDRVVEQYPGGVLIHSGLPNPGFTRVIRDHHDSWRRIGVSTWVHVLVDSPPHVAEVASRLEDMDCAAVIELGFPEDIHPEEIMAACRAAAGKIPLVVDLPLTFPDFSMFDRMDQPELLALSLCAPRGALLTCDQRLVSGRLYGPALYPQALAALEKALGQLRPVIVSGGIDSKQKAQQVLEMGAAAVKFDLPLWTGFIPASAV